MAQILLFVCINVHVVPSRVVPQIHPPLPSKSQTSPIVDARVFREGDVLC